MLSVAEITKIFQDKYPDCRIHCIMKVDAGYIFSAYPKGANMRDILDGYFKITNDGNLAEYSPMMNIEEFKKAEDSIIYLRE